MDFLCVERSMKEYEIMLTQICCWQKFMPQWGLSVFKDRIVTVSQELETKLNMPACIS